MPLLWNDVDLPSADDPSESLEQSMDRLAVSVDRAVAHLQHVREVLSTFYKAQLSASSVQAVLDLAVELDPSLIKHLTRYDPPSTLVRRHLVCDHCGRLAVDDTRIGHEWIESICGCTHTLRVERIELLPSSEVDVLTSDQSPF
jgi:hypothetical protein